jgi:hypothetical protein
MAANSCWPESQELKPMNQPLGIEVTIVLYVVISLAYLAVSALLVGLTKRIENKLLMLGIATAIAAIDYSALQASNPQTAVTGMGLPAILLRAGVVLILAGIAALLLSQVNRGTSSSTGNTSP